MYLTPFTGQVLCAQAEAEKQDMNSLQEGLEPSNGVSWGMDPLSCRRFSGTLE